MTVWRISRTRNCRSNRTAFRLLRQYNAKGTIIIAHETQITGKLSEMTAARALIANGWEVAEPIVPELYDLVAKDPVNGRWVTIQVKTIRRRTDRKNQMVIYGTNGKGDPYQPQDCDYMVGIEGDTVYMTECTGIKEYWATDVAAAKRWVKFTTDEMIEPTGDITTTNNEKAAI